MESQANFGSWQDFLESDFGKEYRMISKNFGIGMREFVRKIGLEKARQLSTMYQPDYYDRGFNPLLVAIDQIENQSSIKIPPTPENWKNLSPRLSKDPIYLSIVQRLTDELNKRMAGTTDLSTLTTEQFSKIIGSERYQQKLANISKEAEEEFRRNYPKLASLYDQKREEEIYTATDGLPDANLDPIWLEMSRLFIDMETACRRFATHYPRKFEIYAQTHPLMKRLKKRTRGKRKVERAARNCKTKATTPTYSTQTNIKSTIFRTTARVSWFTRPYFCTSL